MHEQTILKVREFNRFYLSVMQFYEHSHLGSAYSIAEARVLYELDRQEACRADQIAKELHIDKGYLSRILKRFEREGLLQRQRSADDARAYEIRLTEKGKAVIAELIQKANRGIAPLLRHLSAEECRELESAMGAVQKILTKGACEP